MFDVIRIILLIIFFIALVVVIIDDYDKLIMKLIFIAFILYLLFISINTMICYRYNIIFYEKHILIKNILNGKEIKVFYEVLRCSFETIENKLPRKFLIISIDDKKIIISNYSHTNFTKALNFLIYV